MSGLNSSLRAKHVAARDDSTKKKGVQQMRASVTSAEKPAQKSDPMA
jgi:hypothetical protein